MVWADGLGQGFKVHSHIHTSRELSRDFKYIKVNVRKDGIFPVDKIRRSMAGPLLLLFPLRLGIDRINPCYYGLIKGALRSSLGVGIVGGRPNRSLYFVGHQDDDLFYLDPHCVRPAMTSVQQSLGGLELHTDTVRSCPISELDPSMLLGFVCMDRGDLMELKVQLETLHTDCPLFSIIV